MFSEVFSLFIEEGNKVKRAHKTKFRFATRHSPGQAITKIVLSQEPITHRAPASADSLGPGKREKGLKTGADRLQKWSLLSGSSNRVLSRFSGKRRQVRSQRGAPDTRDGGRSSIPPSRVSGACHSRVADILMGPSRVPVGQESATNPQERLRGRLTRV